MHIAMLAPANVIHTVRWANALSRQGVLIDLMTAHAPSSELVQEIRVHRLPWRAPHGYLLNAAAARNLLCTLKPNLLHTHYASGYGTLSRMAQYPNTLLSVWGSDVFTFPTRSTLHHHLIVNNLRAASRICSTSKVMASQVESLSPQLSRPDVIPWGVDTSLFDPPTIPRRSDSKIVIGTVKTLKPTYGIDTLIEGFAKCRQQFIDQASDLAGRLRLSIAGGGPDRLALEGLAARLGIREVTTFVGEVAHEQVPEELNKLDIYVAMSRSESFGVSIIEASATQRPVIVSDVGGLPEVVEHGQTGLVVPRENGAALADALVSLVQSPDECARLGENGRKRVQAIYEWDRCVEQQIELYASMAAGVITERQERLRQCA